LASHSAHYRSHQDIETYSNGVANSQRALYAMAERISSERFELAVKPFTSKSPLSGSSQTQTFYWFLQNISRIRSRMNLSEKDRRMLPDVEIRMSGQRQTTSKTAYKPFADTILRLTFLFGRFYSSAHLVTSLQ